MEAQRFIVRAMPAQGHDRRWAAQRPFTREPMEVIVTDSPKKHRREIDPSTNRENEIGKILEYSYEVTPAELEEMRRDPHLAVSLAGEVDADPLELNAAKAKILELEQKLADERKSYQGLVEEQKAYHVNVEKQQLEAAGKIAQLEAQTANAVAQLERGKKR